MIERSRTTDNRTTDCECNKIHNLKLCSTFLREGSCCTPPSPSSIPAVSCECTVPGRAAWTAGHKRCSEPNSFPASVSFPIQRITHERVALSCYEGAWQHKADVQLVCANVYSTRHSCKVELAGKHTTTKKDCLFLHIDSSRTTSAPFPYAHCITSVLGLGVRGGC